MFPLVKNAFRNARSSQPLLKGVKTREHAIQLNTSAQQLSDNHKKQSVGYSWSYLLPNQRKLKIGFVPYKISHFKDFVRKMYVLI